MARPPTFACEADSGTLGFEYLDQEVSPFLPIGHRHGLRDHGEVVICGVDGSDFVYLESVDSLAIGSLSCVHRVGGAEGVLASPS